MKHRGVTLVEMLIVAIIASVATLTLAVPFSAERHFWVRGKSQTEAQRDAQLVLRAIAREAREGSSYTVISNQLSVVVPGCGTSTFERLPADGSLRLRGCDGTERVLINGTSSPSKATEFTPTVVSSKLVHIRLNVLYNNRENELLETDLLLRNG